MLQSLKGWFRRRRDARALIESDAQALIERVGEDAYLEARLRQHALGMGQRSDREI
jgi:hypothetical protein